MRRVVRFSSEILLASSVAKGPGKSASPTTTTVSPARGSAAVRKGWNGIKAGRAGWKLDQSFEEHSRFLRTVDLFTVFIGNGANLNLDSRRDSHYLVDAWC
jgi:hypothetical protein